MDRERVHQLVREEDGGSVAPLTQRVLARVDILAGVVESLGEAGLFRSGPCLDAGREVATARALLAHNKGSWAGEHLPHLQELATQAARKEGRNVSAGVVIALPAHLRGPGHIVAVVRLVERQTHIVGKGNGTLALNTFENQLVQR